jgi:hypothetical protein
MSKVLQHEVALDEAQLESAKLESELDAAFDSARRLQAKVRTMELSHSLTFGVKYLKCLCERMGFSFEGVFRLSWLSFWKSKSLGWGADQASPLRQTTTRVRRDRRFGGGPRSLGTFGAGCGSGTAGTAQLSVILYPNMCCSV